MANFGLANRAALPLRGMSRPSGGGAGGGIATRVGGMMGGKGAPAAGPTGGLAGRVSGMMGGGAPKVRPMPGDFRDKFRGGAGLAQRDFETYQGAMTPRAKAGDRAAFEAADRAAGTQPEQGFSQRAGLAGQGLLGGFSGQPANPGAMQPAGELDFSRRMSLAGQGLLSDRQSKTRIRELESELDRTYEALEGAHAEYPDTGLDEAFRRPSASEYEYRDPKAPGAAPGRHVGPMADELRGIPGVVSRGSDGMDRINEPRLTMANTSQLANQRRELDQLHEQLEALGDNPDAVLDRAGGRRGGRR